MAIPLIGQKDVVQFAGHRWWAERGRIHWEKMTDGSYGSMSIRQCLERLQGLNDMVGNTKLNDGFHMPDEVVHHQRYVEQVIDLCKKAKDQGSPDNPSAGRDAKRRRRTMITVNDRNRM